MRGVVLVQRYDVTNFEEGIALMAEKGYELHSWNLDYRDIVVAVFFAAQRKAEARKQRA